MSGLSRRREAVSKESNDRSRGAIEFRIKWGNKTFAKRLRDSLSNEEEEALFDEIRAELRKGMKEALWPKQS